MVAMALTVSPSAGQASPVGSFDLGWHRRSGSNLHATTGVVKSINSTSLVITRGSGRGDASFVLTPSTSLEGSIVVGVRVAIRYREQGGVRIATAVASAVETGVRSTSWSRPSRKT